MGKGRALLRLAAFAGSTGFHGVRVAPGRRPDLTAAVHRARVTQEWGQSACRWLGIRVEMSGHAPAGAVIVANHRSYADIAVLASCVPTTFLAKEEVRGWPVLGWAANRAGTVFVRRDDTTSGALGLRKLRALVSAGVSPVVFPEGTTLAPPGVGPFRRGVFQLAAAQDLPVVPAAVEYALAEDAWTDPDDRTFVSHFLRCFSRDEVPVRIAFGPALRLIDPDALRRAAESWITEHLQPPTLRAKGPAHVATPLSV